MTVWDWVDPTEWHEAVGNDPMAWLSWAETLAEAAQWIRDKRPHHVLGDKLPLMPMTMGVYALVLGYAIECALKGLWVQQGNKIVERGRYVGIPNAGHHELLQMARNVGIETSAAECSVLSRLSRFVAFAGRYPVAERPELMFPVKVAGRGKVDPYYMSADEFDAAEGLLTCLLRKLRRTLE